ncbi:MAG: hypothetical protein M1837_002786 [Sclerophora amabilis]|nr:MAG: hypothetical protein M1837_002786 [Sclerophora amabilis]
MHEQRAARIVHAHGSIPATSWTTLDHSPLLHARRAYRSAPHNVASRRQASTVPSVPLATATTHIVVVSAPPSARSASSATAHLLASSRAETGAPEVQLLDEKAVGAGRSSPSARDTDGWRWDASLTLVLYRRWSGKSEGSRVEDRGNN